MTSAIRSSGSVLFAVLVAALGGCGGGGDGPVDPPAGAPPAADGTIVIKDFKYAPVTATVKVGETVTVTNEDSAVHTLTVPDGIDSGNLAKGKSFTFTPKVAGELDYLCDIHQYMKGTIVVS